MRVSALKSAGWNFAKFGKVRSINPNSIGVGNHGGKDILIVNEAGLHLRSGCLILQDDELREVDVFPKWKQFSPTASMFHSVTSCDSAF